MELSKMNAINGANKANSFVAQKPSSADSGASNGQRDIPARLHYAKLETAMTAPDNKITEDFLQKLIEKVNLQLRGINREFNYSYHEKTHQYMIKIIDRETKEVIREIPPEKSLDAVAHMWEMMGIFVDDKT